MDDKIKTQVLNAFMNVNSSKYGALQIAIFAIFMNALTLIFINNSSANIYSEVRDVRDIAVTTRAEQERRKPVIVTATRELGVGI